MPCIPFALFGFVAGLLVGCIAGAYALHLLSSVSVHVHAASDETIYGDFPHVEEPR